MNNREKLDSLSEDNDKEDFLYEYFFKKLCVDSMELTNASRLLYFKEWLEQEYIELPLCPFIGCKSCNRKMRIARFKPGLFYVCKEKNDENCTVEFCPESKCYNTPKEAAEAWKVAVNGHES